MRHIIIVMLTVIFSNVTLSAQKIYATKSGQITFDASSPIEKISAINNQVDSKFNPTNGQLVVSALIQSFTFENQLMEDHFNENYMESTKFPKADFKGYITDISKVDFQKNGDYPITADGTLTIHGTGKKVLVTGTLTVQGTEAIIKGQLKAALQDYGIKGSYIGDKIAKEVNIQINCKYQ